MSYVLKADKKVCKRCGTCERLVHGFLSSHSGVLPIATREYDTEMVYESVRALIDACPTNAIDICAT